MATVLGRLIGTHRIACVADLSNLGAAAARRVSVTAFTEALCAANAGPLRLVLDEADLWAPQRVEEVVRGGRLRDFVPWLVTRRPAVLRKDAVSQADVLVSMKLTSSQDREAVGRWIEGQADRAEGRPLLAARPGCPRRRRGVGAPERRAGAGGLPAHPHLRQLGHGGPSASRRQAGWQRWTFWHPGRR